MTIQRPALCGAAGLAALVVLGLVILMLVRRSSQARRPVLTGDPGLATEPESRPAPGGRPAGVQVSVQQAILATDGLQVQWQAFNPGPEPVQLFWGQPELSTDGAGVLELRYAAEPVRAAAQSPQLRPAMPGDLLSRSVRVAIDRLRAVGPATKVVVVVGYAPAAAAGDFWMQQELAGSSPRSMEMHGGGQGQGHGA